MSVFPKENIRTVAESIGITVSDDVCTALAHDVDYRLNEVVQEAMKFMRHGKRTQLIVEDVNSALRLKNIEPVYGFTAGRPRKFRKVTTSSADLFYLEDEELDFDTILSAPLPKIPLDVTWTAHWLAVEGVQPAIPQNPPIAADAGRKPKARRKPVTTTGQVATTDVEVKPLVKHVLSKELQLYYERVTQAILSSDDVLRGFALTSLSQDPGLHQLVPYFVQFVAEKITRNLKDTFVLDCILDMLRAMLSNPNLFMEPYLHQIMSPLLTCVVTRTLGSPAVTKMDQGPSQPSSTSSPSEPDHWTLRTKASQLVRQVTDTFGPRYATVQMRLVKTLARAFLDPAKPLTTQFGGITALGMLGPEVMRVVVLPALKEFSARLEAKKEKGNELHQEEVERCYQAVINCVKSFAVEEVRSTPRAPQRPTTPQQGETTMDIDDAEDEAAKARKKELSVTKKKYGNWFGAGLFKTLTEEERRAVMELKFPEESEVGKKEKK